MVLGGSQQYVWDYNADRDLALEAHIQPDLHSPVLWPQLVLEQDKTDLHADGEEIMRIGQEAFTRRFHQAMRSSRNTLETETGRKVLWRWDRVPKPPRRGRYPVRVFTRHPYEEFDDTIHFHCRYAGDIDKEWALHKIDEWTSGTVKKVAESLGVADPEQFSTSRPDLLLRGFVKIGLNLLAYFCEKTQVNHRTFADAVRYVRHDNVPGPSPNDCGFVYSADALAIGCPADAHKFRLTYDHAWRLDCAFFGGRMGATVAFPGPCLEDWRRLEVVAHLDGSDWAVEKSNVLVPRQMRVEWRDLSRIMAAVPMQNIDSSLRVEHRRQRGSSERSP